jgi:hypothetical protein
VHAGFRGFRRFVARKKSRCKLIGNRLVIPHDTIPSNVGKHFKKRHGTMIHGFRFIGLVTITIIFGTIDSYSQMDKFVPENSTIISSYKGADMLRQCSRAVPDTVGSYFDLTINDIQGLENNFKKVLKIKASDCCLLGGVIKNIKDYCFQYVGLVINDKKYIYINAFQIESAQDLKTIYKDWKTSPIVACDGGDSFWGVLYDLETGLFIQLSINGVG